MIKKFQPSNNILLHLPELKALTVLMMQEMLKIVKSKVSSDERSTTFIKFAVH